MTPRSTGSSESAAGRDRKIADVRSCPHPTAADTALTSRILSRSRIICHRRANNLGRGRVSIPVTRELNTTDIPEKPRDR